MSAVLLILCVVLKLSEYFHFFAFHEGGQHTRRVKDILIDFYLLIPISQKADNFSGAAPN